MRKIKEFIRACEESRLGFGLWITSALFIILIRDSIESLVSTNSFPPLNAFHFLHVPVFFLTALLSIIILLRLFTKEDILKVSKICLFFFAVIIFPAGLDLIVSLITKTNISYGYIDQNVIRSVTNFFNPIYKIPAVPYSLRLEILFICIFSFLYIQIKTNKIFLSILGAFLVFCLCTLYGALPGLLVSAFVKVIAFLFHIFHPLFFGKEVRGVVDENIIVIVELILASLAAGLWFWLYDPKKFQVVLKDFRFNRYFCCFILLTIGVGLYLYSAKGLDVFIGLKILAMFLALFFAVRFSALLNDIFDVDCDRVSNKERPLVSGIISAGEYLKVGLVYLTFSLFFSIWVSQNCFVLNLLFIGVYFLYSVPPFRLKRFFVFSSLITGLQALLILLMGQVSLAKDDTTVLLYPPLLWLAFLIFFLGSNIKDLKDIEGDRLCGVYSLPVIFGERKARKIIGFLVFLSYLLFPVFLADVIWDIKITALSLIFAFLSYFYIRKPDSNERIIFLLYFLYVFIAACFFIFPIGG
ncbi:MAG: UbiA family prenyltransferase [Candidatus Omnitrophica bacterium]|nr:UbiA family prenyltransferase [Candidatus Omnitrophota bacterium]